MRFLAIALLISCSALKQRDEQRTLQSKMIRAINAKTPQYAECALSSALFEAFNAERLRVEISLTVGSRGRVDRFQIDKKGYPEGFVDCMFEVSETIVFPKLNPGESVELTQPFIFSK